VSKYFVNYCKMCFSTVLVSEEVDEYPWAHGYDNSSLISLCSCCHERIGWWVAYLQKDIMDGILSFRDRDPVVSILLSDDDTVPGDKKLDRFEFITTVGVGEL